MTRDDHSDTANRLGDSVSLLARKFLSVGDNSFIPVGTTLSCTNSGHLIEMTYEAARAGVSQGTLQILHDGTALIQHDFGGERKSATGRVEIAQLDGYFEVLGEWQSEVGDVRGELKLCEFRAIPRP
jgi:hypothetical protein